MQPGLVILHANQLETLAELAIQHCHDEPLAPLEEEIFLVQSNGMADWLKLKQAEATGISASMRFPMPASFLWEMYQRVLSPSLLNTPSPFAKGSLQWRILRLLPALLEQPEFGRPRLFLADDKGLTKRFQLSRKLADLLDQYQLYRADWLTDWEAGRLRKLGQDEAWQASLWRALIADLPEDESHRSRAHLHQSFLDQLQQADRPEGLPRRLFLFGINSLPAQLLEALHALSRHCQLLLLVLNPCREYWLDTGSADTPFPTSHPLLDAWGSQGLDFLRLLQTFHASESEQQHTMETDSFMEAHARSRADGLLCRLQQQLLDNTQPDTPEPLPERPGLTFLPAFSRQREVEVLHDRLLDLFAEDASLTYGDVVVMTPSIDDYSAHIEAVFNRYPLSDERHLDFTISDRRQQNDNPLFNAVDYLLNLPTSRVTASEVLSLLRLPAIQRAASLGADDVDQLATWVSASHIRWGFDGDHKKTAHDLPATDSNTWQAGLDQLLAGYCAGDADIFSCATLDEVSANQGVLLGKLAAFIQRLAFHQKQLTQSFTPDDWHGIFSDLLEDMTSASTDDERLLLASLTQALHAWRDDCDLANFHDSLPLAQARQGWLDKLEHAGLSQQLAFNGITFCTLMPMRALPFRHVFLLGMNDGDYPREQPEVDFDLMQKDYRPGDRNRRNDDQYLFLEALLSVRDSLTISWLGRDINDNSEKPASTLVEQLRDQVDHCWVVPDGRRASDYLTQSPPLAAFSRRYFEVNPTGTPTRTHNHEWFALHQADGVTQAATARDTLPLIDEIKLDQLVQLLKSPAKVFYSDQLKARNIKPAEADDDNEPFTLSHLELWQLRDAILKTEEDDLPALYRQQLRNGSLPSGHFGEAILANTEAQASNIRSRLLAHMTDSEPLPAQHVSLQLSVALTRNTPPITSQLHLLLTNLLEKQAQRLLIEATASNLKKKTVQVKKLAQTWVRHLAANAAGVRLVSRLIGLDTQIHFPPLPEQTAQQHLNRLYALYLKLLSTPLKVDADETGTLVNLQSDDTATSSNDVQLFHCIDEQLAAIAANPEDAIAHQFFADLLYRPMLAVLEADND